MKFKYLAAILLIVAALGGGAYWLWHNENYEEFFYTKVRDPEVAEQPAGSDLAYEISLNAWNADGKEKKLTFKTNAVPENGEYLKIDVRAFGEVHQYSPVSYADIPSKAQVEISKNQ